MLSFLTHYYYVYVAVAKVVYNFSSRPTRVDAATLISRVILSAQAYAPQIFANGIVARDSL